MPVVQAVSQQGRAPLSSTHIRSANVSWMDLRDRTVSDFAEACGVSSRGHMLKLPCWKQPGLIVLGFLTP